jgi:hypothetical protein
VDRQYLGSCRNYHPRIFQAPLFIFQNADFGSDRDLEVVVEGGYEVMNKRPVFLKEGSIAAFAGDCLRASKVEIYAVTVWRH